jgi:hypothetical protein
VAGIDPKYYWLTLGLLTLCVVVGLAVAYQFQRDVNEDDAPPTAKELMGPLEKAYYSGLMREEEFLRIQESMARHTGDDATPSAKRARPALKRVDPQPAAPDLEFDRDAHPPVSPGDDSAPGPEPG